jgi:hypothetical protein
MGDDEKDRETKKLGAEEPSGDNHPLIPDKIEKDLKKSKFGRWILWVLSLVLVPFLGWFGNWCLGVYQSFETLQQQVHDLQADKANNSAIWSAINENRTRWVELYVQSEAQRMLFEREFKKSVMDRYVEFQLLKEMDREKQLNPKFVPPVPAPPPNYSIEPEPKIPAIKPFDPDEYRRLKEQEFPNKPYQQQQKK